MKLLRYGPIGGERPAMLDGAGNLRDLAGVFPDLGTGCLGDEGLAFLARLDPERLPLVEAGVRTGCLSRTSARRSPSASIMRSTRRKPD